MQLLSQLEKYATTQGNQMAICSEESSLTYKELWEGSGKLAYKIDNVLKDNMNPVVVYGHKHPMMILFFIACVRSGRAYCPIDVSVPMNRVFDIINKTDSRIILNASDTQLSSRFSISIDFASTIIENTTNTISPNKSIQPFDDFYIIFTSGSTGAPKGVRITSSNLSDFLNWSKDLGGSVEGKNKSIFLNQAPFSFDLSVMDLYTCLYTGGTLWTLNKKTQLNMKLLMDRLKYGNINYWVSTPSFAGLCCNEPTFDSQCLPNLKTFLFCGETLTNKTASILRKRFPDSSIINTYGPTEATVAVTSVEITDKILEENESLPVGVPGKQNEITIEDKMGNVMKDGCLGEIIIKGNTVSAGYYKDEEQSKKVFSTTTTSKNKLPCRKYKTGDKGFMINDMVYFSGRMDYQIKYHGYRIELGDIENNLLQYEDVNQTAVLPKYKDDAIKSLVAFVAVSLVPEKSFEEGKRIKAFLKTTLPEYMIPKKIVFLNKLPVTPNGKIDRKALEELL